MTSQVIKDKILKSSLDFKRGRANIHRHNCFQTARKEAREGKTYETASQQSPSTLKEIRGLVPEYTTRQLGKHFKYESKAYNIHIFAQK